VIVVDSSVWVSYFNGSATRQALRLHRALQQDEPLAVLDLFITEVLQGFRLDREFGLARRTLVEMTRMPVTGPTYVNAARLSRKLRARGVVAHTIDCIIAQGCIENAAPLLSEDSDFSRIARHSKLRLAQS
jgi:hypothetical protein